MNNKLFHIDVVMIDEASDHDTAYGTFNMKKERYKPRCKYVRPQHE